MRVAFSFTNHNGKRGFTSLFSWAAPAERNEVRASMAGRSAVRGADMSVRARSEAESFAPQGQALSGAAMIADEKAARQKTMKNNAFFMVFCCLSGKNERF